jgi:methyltransferase
MGSSKKETPFVAAGPYQFIRHPNYLAVVIEFATLPLIGGALLTAIIFSILNFVVLYQRIRAEEQQLFAREGYAAVMGKRSRLLPGVW